MSAAIATTKRKRSAWFSALLLGVATSTVSLSIAAAEAGADEARAQLAATLTAIKEVEVWLKDANAQQSKEEKALQAASTQLAATSRRTAELDSEAAQLERRGNELQRQKQIQQEGLERRENELSEVLLTLHKQGNMSAARAFLSGEGPTSAARQLQYLGRISQAQWATLADYEDALEALRQSDIALAEQSSALQLKREELDRALAALVQDRAKHESALATLAKKMTAQRSEKEQLEMDRASIEQLIEQIDQSLRRIPVVSEGTRFATLKGKLPPPVEAPIVRKFGTDANGINHRGVNFGSAQGDEVIAVHSGRVVFSDFLRGAGLLLILDHGDDYMTLYGGNESLRVEAGTSVAAGTLIATAGGGSANQPGLYFEIRKSGVSQNPASWIRQ